MNFQWENLSRGLLGMLFLVGLCYVLSNNRKAINWRLVSMGIIAQLAFAIGVLSQGKYNFFRIMIQWLSDKFVQVINLAHKGIEFMFGNLADASGSWGYTFDHSGTSQYYIFCSALCIVLLSGYFAKKLFTFLHCC